MTTELTPRCGGNHRHQAMDELSSPRNHGLKFRALQRLARLTRKHQTRGMDRLLRLVYRPDARGRDHISVAVDYDAGLLINVDTSSFLEWYLFFFGHYEAHIVSLMKRLVRPGCVAVDVGANIGCHSLVMSSLAGESGRVIAIEPHPDVFRRLCENIELNRMSNISPLRCALSDKPGQATLHSFSDQDCNKAISSFYAGNVGRTHTGISVDVETLDDVIEADGCSRLDCIKIDTEGNDYRVLSGARKSIIAYRPYVVFEYEERTWRNAGHSFQDASEFLTAVDYSIYNIHSGYLEAVRANVPTSSNLLAVPRLAGPRGA